MKLLELLPSANRGGLLEKMLTGLLTSKRAWSSDRCKMIWKKRVSKSNVLLFQLQASVRGIKGKESGLLATPNTMDHLPPRSKEGTLKLQQGHRKGRTRPSNLREQVDPQTMAMYPTPTPACELGGEQSKRVERTKSGGFITRRVNKPHMTYGAKLSDAMLYLENKKMYPTPVTKDNCTESLETWEKRAEKHKEQGKKNTQGIEDTSSRGSQKYVSNSHNQRLQEHELSQKSEEQRLNSGKLNAGEKPTQSWWQTESKLCGVPNGVSYELDKGRANRIKALGNSIVPQIAEQIFRSIIDAE